MNRGQILRELILEQINALIDGGVIVANDKLRYDADKNYDNPLDIPSLGYIQALIEQGGTTDIRRVFIIPSSEIDGNGEVNLKTDSDGNPRVNEQGDTIIPSDAVVSIYNPRWGSQQYDPSTGIVSGLDPAFDVKVVLIGGENEPQTPFISMTDANGSSTHIKDELFAAVDPVTNFIVQDIGETLYINLAYTSGAAFSGLMGIDFNYNENISDSAFPGVGGNVSLTNTPIY